MHKFEHFNRFTYLFRSGQEFLGWGLLGLDFLETKMVGGLIGSVLFR